MQQFVNRLLQTHVPVCTCAVFLVALYGTSESVARCLPASNTLRRVVDTFRQIAWCLFYEMNRFSLCSPSVDSSVRCANQSSHLPMTPHWIDVHTIDMDTDAVDALDILVIGGESLVDSFFQLLLTCDIVIHDGKSKSMNVNDSYSSTHITHSHSSKKKLREWLAMKRKVVFYGNNNTTSMEEYWSKLRSENLFEENREQNDADSIVCTMCMNRRA